MSGDRPEPEGKKQLIREAGHGIRKPQGRARHPGKTKEGSMVQTIWAEMQKGKPEPEGRRREEVTPNLADNLMNLDCSGGAAFRFLIEAGDAAKGKSPHGAEDGKGGPSGERPSEAGSGTSSGKK